MKEVNKIINKYVELLENRISYKYGLTIYVNKPILEKMIKEIELETLKEHCAKCEKINSMIP